MSDVCNVNNAVHSRCSFKAQHSFAELPTEGDLRQGTETVADRDEAERRARDQCIARFADAGGDDDFNVRISERRIGVGQHADCRSTDTRRTAADGFHYAVPATTDDGESYLRETAAEFFGHRKLCGRASRGPITPIGIRIR